MDEEIKIIMIAPQFMPESMDPIGSEREHCLILAYTLSAPFDDVQFIDNIDEDGTFIIVEFSKDAKRWSKRAGMGIVLREQGGEYSWWFDDITK